MVGRCVVSPSVSSFIGPTEHPYTRQDGSVETIWGKLNCPLGSCEGVKIGGLDGGFICGVGEGLLRIMDKFKCIRLSILGLVLQWDGERRVLPIPDGIARIKRQVTSCV